MANEVELAWCAGFFDGEGHVSYHRGYPHMITGRVAAQLFANVPQSSNNVEVLEKFQRITGLGKIRGPYKTKKKDVCILWFGVKEVESLLHMLKPQLGTDKTRDFQVALARYWMHDPNPTKEDWDRRWKMHAKKAAKLKESDNG